MQLDHAVCIYYHKILSVIVLVKEYNINKTVSGVAEEINELYSKIFLVIGNNFYWSKYFYIKIKNARN